MEQVKGFLKRKNIVISAKRYGIDALGAMAQGLFCSLLIGTILNTIGTQFHIGFLTAQVITLSLIHIWSRPETVCSVVDLPAPLAPILSLIHI